jgi:hypothetical protein
VRFLSMCGSVQENVAASLSPQQERWPTLRPWFVARPKTFRWDILVVPTILPHQAALGAMNSHLVLYWAMGRCVLAAERAAHKSVSSLFAAWLFAHYPFRSYVVVLGVQ